MESVFKIIGIHNKNFNQHILPKTRFNIRHLFHKNKQYQHGIKNVLKQVLIDSRKLKLKKNILKSYCQRKLIKETFQYLAVSQFAIRFKNNLE